MKALRWLVVAAAVSTIVIGFVALLNSSSLANESTARAKDMSRAAKVDWFEIPTLGDLSTWDASLGTVGSGKLYYESSLKNGDEQVPTHSLV